MKARVDDPDFDRLARFQWRAKKHGRTYYAVRDIRKSDGRRTTQHLHHAVLGPGRYDHADGNGLNNQRRNIRMATADQNSANRRKQRGCSSQFKGVCWHHNRTWVARITVRHLPIHLGYFKNELSAAQAYDRAAKKYFGKFAKPNFV